MAEPHRDDDDVITELVKDHRELEEMFDAYGSATTAEEKGTLARRITVELVRHSVAEEQWVYPEMRRVLPDGDAKADKELTEHSEAEAMLKRLERLEPTDAEFDVIVGRIIAEIREHVRDEEGDVFPRLRDALSDEELARLGERVRLAKRTAPTHPHPAAPDHPPLNTLMDPLTGLVDRARDHFLGALRR